MTAMMQLGPAQMPAPVVVQGEPGAEVPRPGSRAARLSHPTVLAALRQVAIEHGVCIRPLAMRRTDLATGRTEVFDLRCGCTREKVCPPCAIRAKILREAQCREGWHREDEPQPEPKADREQVGAILLLADLEYARAACLAEARFDQVADLDDAIGEVQALIASSGLRGAPIIDTTNGENASEASAPARRVRSTRRRQDVPNLPRQDVSPVHVPDGDVGLVRPRR
jgi:hypothetical protein